MFGRSDDRTKKDEGQAAAQAQAPADSKASPPPPPRQAPAPAPAPEAKKTGGEVNAYFGKGSKISGKLNFEGTVRVDGKVDGEIHAKDSLVIGESAEVTAEIHATTIEVRGVVRGDIVASQRVAIRAPGKLYGNIDTPCLVIEEGVIFQGSCKMGSAAEAADQKVKNLPKPKTEAKASEG